MNGFPPILVAGAAHLDRIAVVEGRSTLGASCPGRAFQTVGGAAFNAAKTFRAFGRATEFLGLRGGDAAADEVEEALAAIGARDRSGIHLDRATPSYNAVLGADGDLVIAVADMALYDLPGPRTLARRAAREALASACAVLVDANFPPAFHEALGARAAGRPVAAIGVSPAKAARLTPILPRLSALFLTRREAAALCGLPAETPVADLAGRLSETVMRGVITDGPRPAAVFTDGAVVLQAPPAVDRVTNVTGAGDALAASAFLRMIEGATLVEAARFGMAAAALRISAGLPDDAWTACEGIVARLPDPIPVP